MTGKAKALTAHGLSMLRSVGGWMAIGPEKTYVASSIRGLGPCRSTYVAPMRRDLSERDAGHRLHASLLLSAIASLGIVSACATHRPADRASAACAAALADCQKDAAPVSPGAANRMVVTSAAAAGPASVATLETRSSIDDAAPAADVADGNRTALD
jgi:hypothetical protein